MERLASLRIFLKIMIVWFTNDEHLETRGKLNTSTNKSHDFEVTCCETLQFVRYPLGGVLHTGSDVRWRGADAWRMRVGGSGR